MMEMMDEPDEEEIPEKAKKSIVQTKYTKAVKSDVIRNESVLSPFISSKSKMSLFRINSSSSF